MIEKYLSQIKAWEETAEKRLAQAQSEAEALIRQAKAKAAALIEQRKKAARQRAQEIVSAAQKRRQDIKSEAAKLRQDEVRQFEQRWRAKIPAARDLLLGKLKEKYGLGSA